uniref:Cytochrome P450 CYP12A2-like protein transcript variant 2 n=1 Tax=Spodoptera frugiperda TaxID=7108 RepID=A0A5Q0TYV3_SPOFR|nr:cytochrome P450 CYP12A2-like protein transcript variant 2 [Spodoptera frugiperda]
MQTTRIKPFALLKLVSINKEISRRIAVASTAVNSDTNLKPWKEIPGPPSLPIIGQLHNFLPGGQLYNIEVVDTTYRLFLKYGPIVRLDALLGRAPMIILFDPEACAHILRSENWLPIRPGFASLEYYRKEFKKKFNKDHNAHTTGLITDHGDVWKEFRSTVNPVMLQPKMIKQYTAILDEVAQDMVGRMKANRNEKNMIKNDFDKEMNLWALESIGTVALGCRLNCFDPNLPADSPEWQLIQCVHDLFVTANDLDFKPSLWRYFATPTYKKAMKLYEHHENLTKHFLKKGKEQLKNNSGGENGVLAKLLAINEEVAHIMASDMLFAGVDTAANTVTATLYLLAKNPEKQDKLREELRSGSDRRYLRACVKESLRIMPVVSGNIRKTTKEYSLMGYKIPKDMEVVFAHRDMSLLEEFYPKAKEYIPERWITSKDDPLHYGNTHPFTHQPFGFGARSCIGRRIAELEMDIFVARLIENFQVEWFGPPPRIQQESLNYIKGPFNFIFNDVKK